MKLTNGQKSAIIVFTVSIILFILKQEELGLVVLIVGAVCLLPKN